MRLFVAVNFSPEIKAALMGAIDDLRRQSTGGNFTRADNLHLTLAFIGETLDLRGARAALAAVSAPPFVLTLNGAGRFGDLYWAGLEKSAALTALAASMQQALRDRGFAIEKRPFKPHITLARQLRSEGPVSLKVPRLSMTVGRISLMRSDRVNGRLTYTEVCGKDLM